MAKNFRLKGVFLDTVLLNKLSRGDLERFEKARHAAWLLMEYAPRSVAEIRHRLRLKRFSEAIIDRVIREFAATDLLDDAKYARLVIQRSRFTRPQGRAALVIQLKRKGIPPEVIQEAFKDFSSEEERALALEAASRRFRDRAFADPGKKKKKIFDFLRRRGFGGEVAISTAQRLCSQRESR